MTGFYRCTKLQNVLKSLYGFGRCCQEVRDICMDFEPCLKGHTLISVQRKSIKPGQNLMIHLSMIFHAVVSNYQLVKIQLSLFPLDVPVDTRQVSFAGHRSLFY